MTTLYHERLDVYQLSLQLVASAVALSEHVPRGYALWLTSFGGRRSVPLNSTEGVGKHSKAEQARVHAIARGSAMECGAILDVAKLLQTGPVESIDRAKTLVVRIVEMLTKMCR